MMVQYLTVHKYKIITITLIASFVCFFGKSTIQTKTVRAQLPPEEFDLEQCAEDLTDYINTALGGIDKPLAHGKLLSPSFNLTSPYERQLFLYMEGFEAEFNEYDYFSGNTYRVDGKTPMEYFNEPWTGSNDPIPAPVSWRTRFQRYNQVGGMVFTEWGAFSNTTTHGEYLADLNAGLADAYVKGILYFNPLLTNADSNFLRHQIDPGILGSLASVSPSRIGNNSAAGIDLSGGFINNSVIPYNMTWSLEITSAPGQDITPYANYVNNTPDGFHPIIRICWGSDCGFKDPGLLSKFVNELDAAASKEFYVIVGPNEPLTDPWVSPACGAVDDREWTWQFAPCGGTPMSPGLVDPEYHSLRPYPASEYGCKDPNKTGTLKMCGTSLIAEQMFKYEPTFTNPATGDSVAGDVDINNNEYCDKVEVTLPPIEYETDPYGGFATLDDIQNIAWNCSGIPLKSSVYATVNFDGAELPVLGNTEDVPNGESGAGSLSDEQRVSNYVSWYLQGVIPTAEEDYASNLSDTGLQRIVNFSGPLRKLIPRDIMTGFVHKKIVGPTLYSIAGTNVPAASFYLFGDDYEYQDVPYEGLTIGDGYITEGEHQYDKFHVDIIQPNLPPFNLPEIARGVYYTNETKYGFYLTNNPAQSRHDQIVVCSGDGLPEACYSRSAQERLRKSAAEGLSTTNDPRFAYIPLTTTEDTTVEFFVEDTSFGQPDSDTQAFLDQDYYELLETGPEDSDYDADAILNKNYDTLFYAHLREVSQLSRLLQSTYIPEGFPGNSASGMPPVEDPEILPFCTVVGAYSAPGDSLYGNLGYEDFCPLAKILSAVGLPSGSACITLSPDNHNAGFAASPIKARLDYSTEVEATYQQTFNVGSFRDCVRPRYECVRAGACNNTGIEYPLYGELSEQFCSGALDSSGIEIPLYCATYKSPSEIDTCERNSWNLPGADTVSAKTSYDTYTINPYFEEIFNRLVQGNMSVFRRVFPRLQENNRLTFDEDIASLIVPGPEGKIKNIPAETNISFESGYDETQYNQEELETTPEYLGGNTYSGDPSQNASGQDAKLYFPYLGTIHEHFLKDVQCSFLPAGIGCDNSSLSDWGTGNNELCEPLDAIPADLEGLIKGDCKWQGCSYLDFEISPAPLRIIFEAAGSAYNVPASIMGAFFYNEGGFNSDWSREDVFNAAGPYCQVSNCNDNVSSTGAKGPWQFVTSSWEQNKNAVIEQGVRPAGYEPDVCNLIDSTFAAAKLISIGVYGHSNYPQPKCDGITLNTGSGAPRSCSEWDESDAMTAATQYVGNCWVNSDPSSNVPAYNGSIVNIFSCRAPIGPTSDRKKEFY